MGIGIGDWGLGLVIGDWDGIGDWDVGGIGDWDGGLGLGIGIRD